VAQQDLRRPRTGQEGGHSNRKASPVQRVLAFTQPSVEGFMAELPAFQWAQL
jgi:hypothetical protein